MHLRSLTVLAFVLGSCVVAGCGPTLGTSLLDVNDDDRDESPAAAAFGTKGTIACTDALAFAEAQCDRANRCASSNVDYAWSVTGEKCVHTIAYHYAAVFSVAGVDDRIAACREELTAPGCGPTPTCTELSRKSHRDLGVECSSTDDCKVGLACIDGTCAERLPLGSECNDSDDCVAGAACRERTCQAVTDGAACRYASDCETMRDSSQAFFLSTGEVDNEPFVCDDSTLKCAAVVHHLGEGERCGEGRVCDAGLYCKGALAARDETGTCAKQPAFGEPCNDLFSCLTCVQGVCQDMYKVMCGT